MSQFKYVSSDCSLSKTDFEIFSEQHFEITYKMERASVTVTTVAKQDTSIVNPLVPNAPFLYPQKTSENHIVF